jgi:DNA repair protein SbcD/Mre11
MRILHTADWHVGRTIRGRSRAGEHEAVLGEIVRLTQDEGVDLVLLAGDVFDTAAPSPEAERIVYRALLDLAEVAPVVVVAGNHDNAHRLAAVRPLLAANRVEVGAVLARPDEGGVVDVPVATGEVARVALLPFLSQRSIVRADDLLALDADQHAGRYAARAEAILGALAASFTQERVNLVLSHLTVVGGAHGGGERAAHTVFDYAVPATAFPASAHYVALGHLHRAQRVPAAAPVWYAGSPMQLDFGETANTSAVLLVDAEPGKPVAVRPVAIAAGHRLRTVRGTLGELEAQAGETPGEHVRVVVLGQARAGLAEQVRGWFPDAVEVVVESPDAVVADGDGTTARLGRSPTELFGEYLEDRGATDERVTRLFAELLDEVTTDG